MTTKLEQLFLWVSMLLASSFTLIIFREVFGFEPVWLGTVTGITLLILLLGSNHEQLKQNRSYIMYLNLLFFSGYGGGWSFGLIPWIRNSPSWSFMLSVVPSPFSDILVHTLRLLPALIILTYYLVREKDLSKLYLRKGEINKVAKPVRFIRFGEGETWRNLVCIFTFIFGLGTFIFLYSASRPEQISLNRVVTGLPFIFMISGLNAFNEEFTLRAAPLSILSESIGEEQALALSTVFFALGHYYGVPNGVLGVLLSGFLGWFLGRAILETKGFLLAWFSHLVPDLVIFSFIILFS